jgi:hypothetical protein
MVPSKLEGTSEVKDGFFYIATQNAFLLLYQSGWE